MFPFEADQSLSIPGKTDSNFISITISCKHCLFLESPKSYISEEGGSPCPMDPNSMDVDSISSPPTMVNTQPGCK